jgi:hypothetical protein
LCRLAEPHRAVRELAEAGSAAREVPVAGAQECGLAELRILESSEVPVVEAMFLVAVREAAPAVRAADREVVVRAKVEQAEAGRK